MSEVRATAAERVRFVLVEPRHPGNVGAAARALKNLGFGRLELVGPRCDPAAEEARRLAVGAADVLERARVHPTLDAALAGAAAVAGTSARTGRHRKPHWRLDEIGAELAGAGGEIALVFGRENHGLTDAELDRCTHLVYFPAAAGFSSFNLAQSVLLAAYAMRLALDRTPPPPALEPPADHAAREAMYAHLERALRGIGFLHEHSAEVMMRRLRRALGRAALTGDEVKLIRGIARQALWAAGRAGLVPGSARDEED